MSSPFIASVPVEATLEVVVQRLGDLKEQQTRDFASITTSMESLRQEVQRQAQLYVPRSEWAQRNQLVDERYTVQQERVDALLQKLETDERQRRTPPIAIASFGISLMLAVMYLLQLNF